MKTDIEIIREVALILSANGWDNDKLARHFDDIHRILEVLSMLEDEIMEKLK